MKDVWFVEYNYIGDGEIHGWTHLYTCDDQDKAMEMAMKEMKLDIEACKSGDYAYRITEGRVTE